MCSLAFPLMCHVQREADPRGVTQQTPSALCVPHCVLRPPAEVVGPPVCSDSLGREGFTWNLLTRDKLRVPTVTTGPLFLWPFRTIASSDLWTELTRVLSSGLAGPWARREVLGFGAPTNLASGSHALLGRLLRSSVKGIVARVK